MTAAWWAWVLPRVSRISGIVPRISNWVPCWGTIWQFFSVSIQQFFSMRISPVPARGHAKVTWVSKILIESWVIILPVMNFVPNTVLHVTRLESAFCVFP